MVMPAAEPITTIAELRALPDDGRRHELLDGVHAVTPAPSYRHQDVLMRVAAVLLDALRDRPALRILTGPADLVLGRHTLVQPDLFVIRIDPGSPPESWPEVGVPLLAIEVVSPGTAARDRGAKRRIYQRAGVAEYWVVDPDACLVERWTPDDARPEILDETLEWRVDGARLIEVPVTALVGEPQR
jgi:Uma2 family endonuclease